MEKNLSEVVHCKKKKKAIDGASKVLKVSLLVLMMFATSKLVLIGDHKQLQPFSHFRDNNNNNNNIYVQS